MTRSKKSTTEPSPTTSDVPTKTVRWKLLADCSHSSAVAVGQRSRLAFRKNGLHAFGGYIEGFLPYTFDLDAVSSDDRMLAFLQLSDDSLKLSVTPKHFVLTRGAAVVRFEATADVEMPDFPSFKKAFSIDVPDLELISAMLECVPGTGWGAINSDMLGVVLSDQGMISTDNTTLAWAPGTNWSRRLVLPRPFCLALTNWASVLKDKPKLDSDGSGVVAQFPKGEKLFGALPTSSAKGSDFESLLTEMEAATYTEYPEGLRAMCEEAAIFSEDVTLSVSSKAITLTTAGEISWQRTIHCQIDVETDPITLPLKRFRTTLNYADQLGWGAGRIYLRNSDEKFYAVIAAKS